jgi:DDE superfamily endonuclease
MPVSGHDVRRHGRRETGLKLAHLAEWSGLVSGRDDSFQALHGVILTPLPPGTFSGPFRATASDNRDYFVKALQMCPPGHEASLAVEQVVAQAGKLIGAPVCETSLIRIPAVLAGWTPQAGGAALQEGLAHASLAIEHADFRRPPIDSRLILQRHFVIVRSEGRRHDAATARWSGVVWTADDLAMAAGLSVDLDRWRREFDELMLRVGARFTRVEPRRRMAAFVRGLLAGLPRVNCWTIAEHAREDCPRGMQRLSAAVWDAAGVRDDLRGYVLEHFADPGAVLVADETGDIKKGTMTVAAQRQYTGTVGRTENAQVAVYLAYAAPAGTAFIDRALYLPRSWTGDPGRCRAAGVAEDTAFATKPTLARQMITRALDAGAPAAWAAADEVYGQDPPGHHRDRPAPGDRAGPAAARPGLAAAIGRARRQGSPLV